MPNISVLKNSNFLKKEDCDPAIMVTIRNVSHDNVAKEGAPEELKWVMYFDEFEKGMVLNSTNGQIIAKALGSEEIDDWAGKQIVLYHDPNVSFAGKLVGGIRARAPKPKAGTKPAPVTRQQEPDDALEEPDSDPF